MKSGRVFYCIVAAVLLFITSCASNTVHISDRAVLILPGTDILPSRFEEYQLITGTLPGTKGESVMESFVSFDGKVLEALIIAPSGQTVADVKYDGHKAVMESAIIPGGDVTARYITADLLLVYGNADILKNKLSECGLSVMEEQSGKTTVRTVLDGDRTVYRIEKTDNVFSVANLTRHYSYEIEILNVLL